LTIPGAIAYRSALMAAQSAGEEGSTLEQRPAFEEERSGRRLALAVGGVIAAVTLLAGAWIGTKLLLWGVRRTRGAMRFGFAAASFRLYRRCPDCKRLIRADARVCHHCGYRRPPRGRRARRRAARRLARTGS
jgi:hypothetical protein